MNVKYENFLHLNVTFIYTWKNIRSRIVLDTNWYIYTKLPIHLINITIYIVTNLGSKSSETIWEVKDIPDEHHWLEHEAYCWQILETQLVCQGNFHAFQRDTEYHYPLVQRKPPHMSACESVSLHLEQTFEAIFQPEKPNIYQCG